MSDKYSSLGVIDTMRCAGSFEIVLLEDYLQDIRKTQAKHSSSLFYFAFCKPIASKFCGWRWRKYFWFRKQQNTVAFRIWRFYCCYWQKV